MILTVTLNPAIDKYCIVEKLEIGQVSRVVKSTISAGGKGINVARVARLLGQEVIATGFVAGTSGQIIIDDLEKSGVKTSFIKVNGQTRTNTNIFEKASKKNTDLLEKGFEATKENIEDFTANFDKLLDRCEMVALCGSVCMGVEVDIYQTLTKMAKDKGRKVFLDTSGELLKNGIEAKPFMIKPNAFELEQLLGKKMNSIDDIIKSALELNDKGIEIVVVSMGEDGAIFVSKEGIFRGIPPKINPVSTVGCGDALVGAFIVGFEKKTSIEDNIKMAIAVSSANALNDKSGYFLQDDVNFLINNVQIEKLN
jgi:tagatose 6-phosphate kinase